MRLAHRRAARQNAPVVRRLHLRSFVGGLGTGILGNAAIDVIHEPYKSVIGYLAIVLFLLGAAVVIAAAAAWLLRGVWARLGIREERTRRLGQLANNLILPVAVSLWIGVQSLFGPGVLGVALVVMITALVIALILGGLLDWWRKNAPPHEP